MKYFDIHSHLNLKPLLDDQEWVIARMNDAGVGTITVGVDYLTSKLAIDLATKYENLYACVGMHPTDSSVALSNVEGQMKDFKELAKNEKVVAVGETGLDYFRLTGTDDEVAQQKNNQKEIFIKHIELALEAGKPLMIHARPAKNSMDAYSDALDILESYKLKTESNNLIANFHFFVGDIAIAKRIVKNSWTMSFDGPITFVNDYDEVIASIPIENIMAETDAPFAMPEPYRTAFRADPQSSGKTCEPHMVTEIYKKIAEIKNLNDEECRLVINKNVERVFGIKI